MGRSSWRCIARVNLILAAAKKTATCERTLNVPEEKQFNIPLNSLNLTRQKGIAMAGNDNLSGLEWFKKNEKSILLAGTPLT